jgi:type I pantothenate kinase
MVARWNAPGGLIQENRRMPARTGTEQTASPWVELTRDAWARLRESTPLPLTADDLDKLRGLGEPVDLVEVTDVYLPLSRLLNLYVAGSKQLQEATTTFLGEPAGPVPFVIGLAGSVAVGKSTTARILRELLARWPDHPSVDLITTDGFLLPLAVLRSRGILHRKGFPESYDQRALLRFVANVKAGAAEVKAPVYSHLTYDIVPGEWQTVSRPDILIIEGLNVLQPPRPQPDGRPRIAVSDFFDFSVYVDAAEDDISRWYVERFLTLRDTAFADPRSYFHRYAALSDTDARATAERIWHEINEPNLVQNIVPTRGRATLVIRKAADHSVTRLRLRKR